MDFDSDDMSWVDTVLPMRPKCGVTAAEFDAMEDKYFVQMEDEFLVEDWLESFTVEKILDAKYDNTFVNDIENKLEHLLLDQKTCLLEVLKTSRYV